MSSCPKPKPFRLTESVKAAGERRKLSPRRWTHVGKLARQQDPNVLVGFDHADERWRVSTHRRDGVVQTVDFSPPSMDDPYTIRPDRRHQRPQRRLRLGGKAADRAALVCFR